MSSDELDKMMPVSPPRVNSVTNPRAQYLGAVFGITRPKAVAIHLKTLIPVGTAIIMVVAVK